MTSIMHVALRAVHSQAVHAQFDSQLESLDLFFCEHAAYYAARYGSGAYA